MPSSNRSSSKSSTGDDPVPSTPQSGPSTRPSTQNNSSPLPIARTADMIGANISRKRTRDEENDIMNLPAQMTPATSPTSYYGNTIARRDPLTGQRTVVEGQTQLNAQTIEQHLANRLNEAPRHGSIEEDVSDSPARKALRTTNGNDINGVNEASLSPDTRPTGIGPGEPVVDEFSRLFGIGWRQPSPTARQGSARGWARYIETHYPLTNVEIMALTGERTLVRSNEGTFLFREDLRQGQLLSRDYNEAAARLRQNPVSPVFESAHPITANPQANEGHSGGRESSPSQSPPRATAGVDVDAEMEMD